MKINTRLFAAALLLPALTTTLAFLAPIAAAEEKGPTSESWCGTRPSRLDEALARQDFQLRQLERKGLPLKSSPTVYQDGQIAVIEDDGTLISQPRPFDLQGKSMQYLRRPAPELRHDGEPGQLSERSGPDLPENQFHHGQPRP